MTSLFDEAGRALHPWYRACGLASTEAKLPGTRRCEPRLRPARTHPGILSRRSTSSHSTCLNQVCFATFVQIDPPSHPTGLPPASAFPPMSLISMLFSPHILSCYLLHLMGYRWPHHPSVSLIGSIITANFHVRGYKKGRGHIMITSCSRWPYSMTTLITYSSCTPSHCDPSCSGSGSEGRQHPAGHGR